jgi:hypothetical protein
MKFILLLSFLCIVITASSCNKGNALFNDTDNAIEGGQAKNLDIYLFIGQSNMAGRAEIEVQDRDTLNGVFLYKGLPDSTWEKAANPLNKYSSIRKKLSIQKLNPAYTFAIEMREMEPEKQIGLVVNAKGGTSISLWEPGSEFYKQAVMRTKAAMQFGTLKGIAWHQGESDASKYDSYMPKIIALIEALRAEFNSPNLPFVVGQLSEDREKRIPFNQMIIQLPSKINNVGVVTTENTSTIDSTHFDSASQRILGERYANEMLKLKQELHK